MNGPLVRVEGLSGGYRPGTDALSGVAFEAHGGEVVAVLGPNGGGKSTLFRALLGELPYRRGTVELAGRPAYVPQTERARLDFPVSALDVALMGAYGRTPWFRRLARADRAAARAAIARVGLEAEAGERFGALSGGQRQRVLIARALVQDAPVLLLDEPLSGVDAPSAARIEALFEELRGEGRALLVATHDARQARAWQRVLCLNRVQVAFGAAAEVLTPERPAGDLRRRARRPRRRLDRGVGRAPRARALMLGDPITRRALVEVLILALALGPLGVWVLLHRQAYAAESLSHGLLPGLVLAALAGLPLVLGAAGGALVAAGAIALAGRDERIGADIGVAVAVSALFGLGAMLALAPDAPPRLEELLFGDLLGSRAPTSPPPARSRWPSPRRSPGPTGRWRSRPSIAPPRARWARRRRAGRPRCSRCWAWARSPRRPGSAACCWSRS